MLSVLMKVNAEVECIIDDELLHYPDGASAFQELKNEYSIISIIARDNIIILELEKVKENSDWKKDYKKQFGDEPSFF